VGYRPVYSQSLALRSDAILYACCTEQGICAAAASLQHRE
jgi:hypothetical protein